MSPLCVDHIELCHDRNPSDYKDLIEKHHEEYKSRDELCHCADCVKARTSKKRKK